MNKTKKTEWYPSFIILLTCVLAVASILNTDILYKFIGKTFISDNILLVFNNGSKIDFLGLGVVLIILSIMFLFYKFIRNKSWVGIGKKSKLSSLLVITVGFILILVGLSKFTAITQDNIYFIHNLYSKNIELLPVSNIENVDIVASSGWHQKDKRDIAQSVCKLELNIVLYDKNKAYNFNLKLTANRDKVYQVNALIDSSVKRNVNYTPGCNLEEYRLELQNAIGVSVPY